MSINRAEQNWPDAAHLLTTYRAFVIEHRRVEQAELAGKTLYCVCGREFPDGQVSRVLYGSVQFTSNRCGHCCDCNRDLTTDVHNPECIHAIEPLQDACERLNS